MLIFKSKRGLDKKSEILKVSNEILIFTYDEEVEEIIL